MKTLQGRRFRGPSASRGWSGSSAARPPMTTSVEIAAIACPRRACGACAASRSARRSLMTAVSVSRRGVGPAARLLEHRRVRRPGSSTAGSISPVRPSRELFDRLRDAGGQRRVLRQQGAPLVAARGAELADDGRLRDLDRGQVERRSAGRRRSRRSVPFFSAVTTSLELLKTCGLLSGSISSSTASRLVVPIWTPIVASFRSASEVALAASEPFSATTAWLAV